jgi:hypothetical protein
VTAALTVSRRAARTPGADLSLDDACRIALAAQGFDRPRPRGRVDARHLRRTIRQLGLLQIDSVNVLLPAHYQVPFSRLGPYERSQLDDLIYRRREFTEQWAHETSILPMESWPLLRHRMDPGDRRVRALSAPRAGCSCPRRTWSRTPSRARWPTRSPASCGRWPRGWVSTRWPWSVGAV